MKQKNKIGVDYEMEEQKSMTVAKNVADAVGRGFLTKNRLKKKQKQDQKTFERYLSGRTDYWYEKSISL